MYVTVMHESIPGVTIPRGIYTIVTNQIKCPGVFPGGGGVMVMPTIDSCITLIITFVQCFSVVILYFMFVKTFVLFHLGFGDVPGL